MFIGLKYGVAFQISLSDFEMCIGRLSVSSKYLIVNLQRSYKVFDCGFMLLLPHVDYADVVKSISDSLILLILHMI